MADVHSKETRSYNMSRIRSKDTRPEMLVRRFLHRNGFRYRLHVKNLPGKPDMVLPKYKTVIFIHGCFWHGHEGCRRAALPTTRKDWWKEKITYNIANDDKSAKKLIDKGWQVIVVWQCQLKMQCIEATLMCLIKNIKQTNRFV
jgi:DNA mismatch endonuclease (patch repair protein)